MLTCWLPWSEKGLPKLLRRLLRLWGEGLRCAELLLVLLMRLLRGSRRTERCLLLWWRTISLLRSRRVRRCRLAKLLLLNRRVELLMLVVLMLRELMGRLLCTERRVLLWRGTEQLLLCLLPRGRGSYKGRRRGRQTGKPALNTRVRDVKRVRRHGRGHCHRQRRLELHCSWRLWCARG